LAASSKSARKAKADASAPTPDASNGDRSSVRERIARDVERHYDASIAAFFEDALAAEKVAWADCSTCRHRVKVSVPDWGARVRALELLLNQGFGRPSSEAETQPTEIVLERLCTCGHVCLGCEEPAARTVGVGEGAGDA
jgi:hypothetical protein